MESKLNCSCCNKEITNEGSTAKFDCPNCGKSKIIRCKHCREIVAKYKCPACNFEGPN